jgi:putative ABC transport system ATP-binding protein
VAASYADRVVFLADGRFVGDIYHPTAEVVAERMTRLGAWADETQVRSAPGGAF